MKRTLVVSALVCCTVAAAFGADVLSQLGITPAAAKEAVSEVLGSGVMYPGLGKSAFKAAPPPARAAMATQAVAWLQSFTTTPEFKQMYLKLRENRKPDPPTFKGTPEEESKASAPKDPLQDPDTQKMLASLPADQRKAMEDALKNAAALIAQSQTPEAEQMRLQAIKSERADKTQQYQRDLAKWQKEYPEDAKPLVIQRLHEFLDFTADVDFTAQTNGPNHTGSFVNPAYESKPGQWKLCYRAGKDATLAARTAAQAWLKQLGG